MPNTMRNNTLIDNIAGNLVRAGQHRPLVSGQGAVLQNQQTSLHNNLMQTQAARAKQIMEQETQAVTQREKNIAGVNSVLNAIGTKKMSTEEGITVLQQRLGAEGDSAAKDLISGLERQRETADYNSPTKGFTASYTQFLQSNGAQASPESYAAWQATKDQTAKAGATTVNIDGKEDGTNYSKVNQTVVESLLPRREEAIGTAGSLELITESEKIINSKDVISGKFGDFRLGYAKLANLAGANNDELIANTESFFSSMGRQTAEIIKAFGAGTGLSDADREYAQGIAGGDIKQSQESIKRLMKMAKKAYRYKLKKYNEDAEYVHGKDPEDKLMLNFRVPYQATDPSLQTTTGGVVAEPRPPTPERINGVENLTDEQILNLY